MLCWTFFHRCISFFLSYISSVCIPVKLKHGFKVSLKYLLHLFYNLTLLVISKNESDYTFKYDYPFTVAVSRVFTAANICLEGLSGSHAQEKSLVIALRNFSEGI